MYINGRVTHAGKHTPQTKETSEHSNKAGNKEGFLP
jgi:hypothetical protein